MPQPYPNGELVIVVDCSDLEAEVARVADLGAILLTSQPVVEDGWRWHVLGDPDGNEFCVLEPPERP
jgi:predicted enzyme related to lactoylglutathione lyase